jgi:hypothetical protein
MSSYHMWRLCKKMSEFRIFFTHDAYKTETSPKKFHIVEKNVIRVGVKMQKILSLTLKLFLLFIYHMFYFMLKFGNLLYLFSILH